MKPEQAEALLRVAEKHYPDTVLAFVLMLFMGVRPEEVKRMSGDDITEDGVVIPDEDEVTGQEQKTGRRFIHMTDVVAEWLQHYPPSESIVPQNWKRKWDAARRLAGWAVKADFFKGTELYDTSNLPPWHQDILRHTAATICINMGKPMTVLIFEHGHTLGETTLKKHYLGRMTKREALGILSIGPKDKKLKPLTMKAV
jgi:integrase